MRVRADMVCALVTLNVNDDDVMKCMIIKQDCNVSV